MLLKVTKLPTLLIIAVINSPDSPNSLQLIQDCIVNLAFMQIRDSAS